MFERHFLRGAMLATGLALLVALLLPMLALAEKDPPVDVLGSEWHDASRLELAIDDNGGWDSDGLEANWPCPGDCVDHTATACLLAGNGEDALADGCWDGEWETTAGGAVTITEPGVLSDEYGYAQYEDTGPGEREASAQQHLLGLRVTQHSCAWERTDFVLVSYVFRNVSGHQLTGLYAGHYADLDVAKSPGRDVTDYYAPQSLAYNCDRDAPYCLGLRYFTGQVSSYNSMPCCLWGDADVFPVLSNGQIDSRYPPTGSTDVQFIMGMGPLALAPGEEWVLGTAWVAGESVGELKANADQALAAWQASNGCGTVEVEAEEFVPEPGSILLLASGFLGLAGYAGLRARKR
jgi:hypothetical protein